MSQTMTRPTVTLTDQKKAKRLRDIWHRVKSDLGLTQVIGAKKLGITQPTFSQYLNAIIPLNMEAIFKFADLLDIDPVEIDPALENIHSLRNYRKVTLDTVLVPYIGSTSGRATMGRDALKTEKLPDDGTFAGVLVDNNTYLEAGIPKGSTIVLDLAADPFIPHRNIAIRLRGQDGFRFYKFHSTSKTTIRVQDLSNDNKLTSIRAQHIAQINLVYQITMPQ